MLQLPRPGAGPAAELPTVSQAWRRHAARRRVKVKCGERRAALASTRGPRPRSWASVSLGRPKVAWELARILPGHAFVTKPPWR